MKRFGRLAYLFFVGLVTAFIVGFTAFSVAESAGGVDEQPGTLLDRVTGETTLRGPECSKRVYWCRERTFPTYSLIGAREDGTSWIVVGEGAFNAMARVSGPIDVSTSAITGRVVALEADGRSWRTPSSAYIAGSFVGLAVWIVLLAAYERQRRSGRWAMGRFRWPEQVIVGPAVLCGIGAVFYFTMFNTWGLEVTRVIEPSGTFIADPAGFAIAQEEADRGPGVAVNEPFNAGSVELTVVGPEQLNDDVLAAWSAASSDVLAIPLLRSGDPIGQTSRVDIRLRAGDQLYEPTSCPGSLLTFPSSTGQRQSYEGFVCFEKAAEGGLLGIYVGSSTFSELKVSPAYALADGTIVEDT